MAEKWTEHYPLLQIRNETDLSIWPFKHPRKPIIFPTVAAWNNVSLAYVFVIKSLFALRQNGNNKTGFNRWLYGNWPTDDRRSPMRARSLFAAATAAAAAHPAIKTWYSRASSSSSIDELPACLLASREEEYTYVNSRRWSRPFSLSYTTRYTTNDHRSFARSISDLRIDRGTAIDVRKAALSTPPGRQQAGSLLGWCWLVSSTNIR